MEIIQGSHARRVSELEVTNSQERATLKEQISVLEQQLREEKQRSIQLRENYEKTIQSLREENENQLHRQRVQYEETIRRMAMEKAEALQGVQLEKEHALVAERNDYEMRLQQVTTSLQLSLEQKEKRIADMKAALHTKEESIVTLSTELTEKESRLREHLVKIESLEKENHQLEIDHTIALQHLEQQLHTCNLDLLAKMERVGELEGAVRKWSEEFHVCERTVEGLKVMVENQKVLNMGTKECMVVQKYFHSAMTDLIEESRKKEDQSPLPDPLRDSLSDPLMACLLSTEGYIPDSILKSREQVIEPKYYTGVIAVLAVIVVFFLMQCCCKWRIPSPFTYQ